MLRHGADLSLLILDPASAALRAELNVRQQATPDLIDGVLASTMLNLQVLADNVPRHSFFRLGFHPVFPSYGLTILDPDDDDGLCFVEMYPTNKRAGATFVVHAVADAAWFKYFVEEFVALRSQARVYEIHGPADVATALGEGQT
jgi:hypothetical protein